MVYNLISDQVTVQPSYTSGEKYFNKKAIRLDYERDWKLLRQLKNFELLRDKILDDLIPKPPANLFRRKNSKFSSSILKRYENSFDSCKSNDDINSDDEEIKLPRRLANAIIERDDEYFMEDKCDLKHATLVVNSLGQLQQEICGDTSDSSNKHSTELDQSPNSSKNDRIEEDRIKLKMHNWNWLPLKLGLLFHRAEDHQLKSNKIQGLQNCFASPNGLLEPSVPCKIVSRNGNLKESKSQPLTVSLI